jgi:DNA-directed RNA polymerase subunit L
VEIEVLKKEKNNLMLKIEGETHTLANLLCSELYTDSAVKSAAYTLDHPLTGAILLHVRTDGKSPEKALLSAADRIVNKFQDLKQEFQSKFRKT